ncbi:MAG: hypothetical protein IPO25_19875 [Saprospiraceae bacterium]|nr:hypothetical protein [Saprospiraceae bacterium]
MYFRLEKHQNSQGNAEYRVFAAFVVNTLTAIKHPNAYLEYAMRLSRFMAIYPRLVNQHLLK